MQNNLGVIFRRTLYDNRRGILWWSIGMGLMGFYVTVVYPLISEFEEINELLENPIFAALLGDSSQLDYLSAEGFLGIEFFTFAPLILAVYAVIFGAGIVGGEEERGTLDILLSTPVPRWQLIVEKFTAFVVALVVILFASGLGIMLAVWFTADLSIAVDKVAWAVVNMIPTLLVMTTLALFLTTTLRSRGQAGGIAAGIIVASYFINSFAEMAENGILRSIQRISFYNYYSPMTALTQGVNWGNFALLMGLAIALFAGSLYFFERRDLSV